MYIVSLSAFVGVNHGSSTPSGNNTNQWKRIADLFKEFGNDTSKYMIKPVFYTAFFYGYLFQKSLD